MLPGPGRTRDDHLDVAAQTLAWRGESVRRAEQDKDAAKLLTWAREAEAFRRMNRFAFAREFPQHARSAKVLEATVAEAEKYSPEDGAKLFAAFTRVNISNPNAPEGTGLGLHLSQKLAELLRGKITLKSEYGKGSTFTLVLPEQ